jgi:hypothetical protein
VVVVVVVVVELRKQVVRVRPQLDVLDRIGGWGGGENRVRKTAVERVESKEKRVKRRRRRGPVLYAGVVGRKMVEQYGGELDSVVQVRQISRSRQGRSRVKAGGWSHDRPACVSV